MDLKEALGVITPVEFREGVWFKRDDQWELGGAIGGKARACFGMAQGAKGLVTAGSRQSPQIGIVARVARYLGIPCRAHAPRGELSEELKAAKALGAEILQHIAGYNNVICSRAHEDALNTGWLEIPMGMECLPSIASTRRQVQNLPREIKRLVVPVGSGMSLAGILYGLQDVKFDLPVLGVRVGADPLKRLNKYAPVYWRRNVTLESCDLDYHKGAENVYFNGVKLDSGYEAKCIPFLREGDCLWCVGIRSTERECV